MHDQRAVRHLDCTADHQEQHQALVQVQPALAGVARDGPAIDQFQRDVGQPVVGDPAFDQVCDARMPQACQRLAFAPELALRVAGVQATRQQLDGDFLAHAIDLAKRAEHGGRAALAQHLEQLERSDATAGRQRIGDAGVADRTRGAGGVAAGQQLAFGGVGGQHAFGLGAPPQIGATLRQPSRALCRGQLDGRFEQVTQCRDGLHGRLSTMMPCRR